LIEFQMVRRMATKALWLAPIVIGVAWIAGGSSYGISAAAGLAMTVGNLLFAGRIIGGVAEKTPQLLLPVGLAAFALGLLLLTGVMFALQATDIVYIPVTGFVLVGSHLLLVLWEAAGAYRRIDSTGGSDHPARGTQVRSR
jgi:hypothetical protein